MMTRRSVGSYPTTLQNVFSEADALDDFVVKECTQRSMNYDPVSKEMIELKNQEEPDISFPAELKFTVEPTLNTSKVAFKNLLNGFADKSSVVELLSDLPKYHPDMHHDPRLHPLRHFEYPQLVKEWATPAATDSSQASSS